MTSLQLNGSAVVQGDGPLVYCRLGEASGPIAADSTSHIAGSTGSNIVIAAKSKAIFWWDPNTSLWYL